MFVAVIQRLPFLADKASQVSPLKAHEYNSILLLLHCDAGGQGTEHWIELGDCFWISFHWDGQTGSTQTDSSVSQSDEAAPDCRKMQGVDTRAASIPDRGGCFCRQTSSGNSHGGRPDIDQGRHNFLCLSFHSGHDQGHTQGGFQPQPGPRTSRCGASLHLQGQEDGGDWRTGGGRGVHVWNSRQQLGANLQRGGWIISDSCFFCKRKKKRHCKKN